MKDFILAAIAWFCQPIKDGHYWLRSRLHPKYRYHVVKTGLRPGYYDEDDLILHSCMALLERFVAWHGGEQDFEKFTDDLREPDEWGTDWSRQIHKQTEALAIWRWWKYQRPQDERHKDQLWDSLPPDGVGKYDVVNDFEEKMLNDEQGMLWRLIEIRPGLWE